MADETNKIEQQPAPDLQVTAGDLALLVKIIDAGSERGAWKGEELGTIGAIRTKMAQIVKSVAPVEDTVDKTDEEDEDSGSQEVEAVDEVDEDEGEPKPKKRAAKKAAA